MQFVSPNAAGIDYLNAISGTSEGEQSRGRRLAAGSLWARGELAALPARFREAAAPRRAGAPHRGGGCGPGPGSGGFAPPHVGNRPKDPICAGRGREGCSGLAAGRSEVKPPRGFGRAAERDYGILRKCACSGGFVRAGPGASGGAGSGAGPRGLCGAPGPRWGRDGAAPEPPPGTGAPEPGGPGAPRRGAARGAPPGARARRK